MITKPIFKTISDCFLETSQIKDFSEEDFQNLYQFLEHRNVFNDIWSLVSMYSFHPFRNNLANTNPDIKDRIYYKFLKESKFSILYDSEQFKIFYTFCKDVNFFRIELIQKCLDEVSILPFNDELIINKLIPDMKSFVDRTQQSKKILLLERHNQLIEKIDLFLEQQQNKPKNRII